MINQNLVIGLGNPLRGDDRLGWEVVDKLAAINIPNLKTFSCHQLTPELAEEISYSNLVVFVDASMESLPGEVSITGLKSLHKSLDHFSAHDLSPQGLLNLCRYLYQKHPTSYLVSIGAKTFEPGESLSPEVEKKLDQVISRISQLILTNQSRGNCQ